jgi:hypothetical protein
VFIPIVDLAAMAAILFGFAGSLVFGGHALTVAAIALVTVFVLSAVRALRIAAGAVSRSPLAVAQAFLVALTYDLARAAALVTRAPHHRRAPAVAATPGPVQ